MALSYSQNGSPIAARQTMPFAAYILIILFIFALIFAVWFMFLMIKKHKKSEKYLQKEMSRTSTQKDVKIFAKNHNFSKDQEDLLWDICKATLIPNINFSLKTNEDVLDLFRNAHDYLLQNSISDKKLYELFLLLFQVELIVANTKNLNSTRYIPLETTIFFITEHGSLVPFKLVKNDKDFFFLELPEHFLDNNTKPEVLQRQRFTFKTKDGLSYNFVSRIMRYDDQENSKSCMVVAHTDQLEPMFHRHFKREYVDEPCTFFPVKTETEEKNKEISYIISQKEYKGKLTNISAGGCCIRTILPIKENQYICILLSKYNINEKIVGIIKKTRRFPDGTFALHIKFVKISLKTRNAIFSLIYKFDNRSE